jgi:predicted DNA-binding transcriptional regulator AlpA
MEHNNPEEKILRLHAVMSATGHCRSIIYLKMRAGRFPKQKNIGKRAVGWSHREIQTYIRITLEGGEYFAS